MCNDFTPVALVYLIKGDGTFKGIIILFFPYT